MGRPGVFPAAETPTPALPKAANPELAFDPMSPCTENRSTEGSDKNILRNAEHRVEVFEHVKHNAHSSTQILSLRGLVVWSTFPLNQQPKVERSPFCRMGGLGCDLATSACFIYRLNYKTRERRYETQGCPGSSPVSTALVRFCDSFAVVMAWQVSGPRDRFHRG